MRGAVVGIALGAIVLMGSGDVHPPTPFTAAQADRGAALFQQSCATCHGDTFQGSTGAPALSGPSFRFGWNGKQADELFAFIKSSMPPGQAGALSDQQYADIIAATLRGNGVVSGEKELPADEARLKTVTLHID